MPFSLHEPFPSLSTSKTNYMHTGRGGAGNIHRTTPKDITSRNPLARTHSLSPTTSNSFSSSSSSSQHASRGFSGRGGAGNVYPLSEKALFSFDEELERAGRLEREAAPVYHIGRGGAGNTVHKWNDAGSVSSGSTGSGSSRKGSEERDGGFLGRIRSFGSK